MEIADPSDSLGVKLNPSSVAIEVAVMRGLKIFFSYGFSISKSFEPVRRLAPRFNVDPGIRVQKNGDSNLQSQNWTFLKFYGFFN